LGQKKVVFEAFVRDQIMKNPQTPPLKVASQEEAARVELDGDLGKRIDAVVASYPTKQAALLPVLWACQERWGWISTGIMEAVAARLELSPAYVEGVVTFYTMFRRTPPGRYLLQVCTTLSCQLCGAGEVVTGLKEKLGIDFGETTSDRRFSLVDVQCLGACGEGPVIQINDDYHVQLAAADVPGLLDSLE
jgi:NADH-quinone oxidoreductase E subunit